MVKKPKTNVWSALSTYVLTGSLPKLEKWLPGEPSKSTLFSSDTALAAIYHVLQCNWSLNLVPARTVDGPSTPQINIINGETTPLEKQRNIIL